MQELRTIPIHRSLNRRILTLGGEKTLVEFVAFLCILLALGGMTKVSVFLAVLIWFCSLPILQYMAKIDPFLSGVFLLALNQPRYFPAKSSPYRNI